MKFCIVFLGIVFLVSGCCVSEQRTVPVEEKTEKNDPSYDKIDAVFQLQLSPEQIHALLISEDRMDGVRPSVRVIILGKIIFETVEGMREYFSHDP